MIEKHHEITGYTLRHIMSEDRAQLLEAYTTPVPVDDPYGRLPSQEAVKEMLRGDPRISDFKRSLLWGVARVSNGLYVAEHTATYQQRFGFVHNPWPVELLVPDNNLMYTLLRARGFRTVDEVGHAPADQVTRIAPSRGMFMEIRERIRDFYPYSNWDRVVTYRDELTDPGDYAIRFPDAYPDD